MSTGNAGRRGRDFWAPVVAEFEAAPEQHEAFALARGLNVDTFRRWLYRLRREQTKRAGRFEIVRVTPSVRPRAACVVEVSSARVVFDEAPEPEYLARLLSAMGT
jgi:hypothetical protein